MNILLIEPDRELGQIYTKALEQTGAIVHVRKTAETAVRALDEYKVDVIFLELQIALHNGIEFLYEMRSYADWQDVKVILLTNVRKTQLDSTALQQLGVSGYLYKPTTKLIDLQQLVKQGLQPIV